MAMKMAIVGFGGMGGYHYANITEKLSDILTVKGIFDFRPDRCEFAKTKNLHVYASLEDCLSDPEIELVLVSTPNNYHHDISINALRHGKNVVCEKPVTLNAKELEEVLAVAKETGKVFTVHQNRRWDKDYRIVKEAVESGLLGKPYMIESRVQGSKRVLQEWRGRKENGGGMVLDWGIHILDQAMWLDKSKVKEVYANLYSIFTKEVDDNCKIIVKFESGLSYLLQVDSNCFINQARWHVLGEDGTLVINDWSCNGKVVRLIDEKDLGWDDFIVYTEAGPTRTMAPRPRETVEELPLPEVKTDWCEFYRNVVDTINGKAELIVKPSESLRVMKVVDAIFESNKQGKSISCDI